MCFFIISSLITILSGSSSTLDSWSSFFVLFSILFPLFSSLFFFYKTLFIMLWLGCGLINLFTTPQGDNYFDFPHLWRFSLLSLHFMDTLGILMRLRRNFPFSCIVLRLVSLEIAYWTLSIFWDRSFCIPSILLFNVLSTLLILWFSWALMDF